MSVIHETAWVDPKAELADDVKIGPYCVVYEDVRIGSGTILHNNVTVFAGTSIGRNNQLFPGATLGGPPQDWKYAGGETKLTIGDDNMIREHVTMNKGTEHGGGVTRVGSRSMFMACSHVAHDCQVDDEVILGNNVLPAGHVHIGRKAILSGGCALHHFTTVGEYAFIGGLSRIVHDVPPFMIVEGNPSEVRSVNLVGLRRAEFTNALIEQLREAYRLIFRGGKIRRDALDEMDHRADLYEETRRLLEFLHAVDRGKHGRQRQP
jgi:UDP-N-acetylglucosamine acyltransferase